jgi:hypothetical protein
LLFFVRGVKDGDDDDENDDDSGGGSGDSWVRVWELAKFLCVVITYSYIMNVTTAALTGFA